jgi:hypothetical protein
LNNGRERKTIANNTSNATKDRVKELTDKLEKGMKDLFTREESMRLGKLRGEGNDPT